MSSRQQIPLLFGFDVIHGYKTLFQIPLGEAASWDPQAAKLADSIAAAEARVSGIHWTFAPIMDLARDPRWGRVMEGSGEDAFLGSEMAKARVLGFRVCMPISTRNDYSRPDKVMACAKHFAGYGAAEAGRDYASVDMSERQLREVYLPPFKAAIEAGIGSVMTAYMDLNGVPISGNQWMLRKILREEWGFDGMVVSDFMSISDSINPQFSADDAEAAMHALNAGIDMEMVSASYANNTAQLIRDKKVTMDTVDAAVGHILRAKFRLGLFDNPYTDERLASKIVLNQNNLQTARKLAAGTFVLLKNDKNTLPISKRVKRVAVIGSLANDKEQTMSSWNAQASADDSVTLLEAIINRLGSAAVKYAPGCNFTCESTTCFAEAVKVAAATNMEVLVLGEPKEFNGETASQVDIGLPGTLKSLV
ncbi:hypothetical protein RvY_12237 [Ramazzottius varieornatus]|uniref:beta-glucosidase n=1 Tax=Ramazzottius varieornatus TaxID=947166 RepID=A0A1D1VKT9_RAMVA|nr:hypothetical protein RvY_12237 [Ramazzottius varieornatus]